MKKAALVAAFLFADFAEIYGAFQIMGLPRRQEEVQRIAQRIDQGMDFRAQSAFAAPDRLVFAVFFCAPALC